MAAFAIQTARLTLRDWTEADLAPFLEHTNTPEVMRWLGGVQSEEEVRRRLRARIMVWQRTRGFTFWAVPPKISEMGTFPVRAHATLGA